MRVAEETEGRDSPEQPLSAVHPQWEIVPSHRRLKKRESNGGEQSGHHPMLYARPSQDSVAELRWCFPAMSGSSHSLETCLYSPREG